MGKCKSKSSKSKCSSKNLNDVVYYTTDAYAVLTQNQDATLISIGDTVLLVGRLFDSVDKKTSIGNYTDVLTVFKTVRSDNIIGDIDLFVVSAFSRLTMNFNDFGPSGSGSLYLSGIRIVVDVSTDEFQSGVGAVFTAPTSDFVIGSSGNYQTASGTVYYNNYPFLTPTPLPPLPLPTALLGIGDGSVTGNLSLSVTTIKCKNC